MEADIAAAVGEGIAAAGEGTAGTEAAAGRRRSCESGSDLHVQVMVVSIDGTEEFVVTKFTGE